ncbi:MAG: hypothetical protein ACTFAL_16195 [Candidatus Electronema sp. V4]
MKYGCKGKGVLIHLIADSEGMPLRHVQSQQMLLMELKQEESADLRRR